MQRSFWLLFLLQDLQELAEVTEVTITFREAMEITRNSSAAVGISMAYQEAVEAEEDRLKHQEVELSSLQGAMGGCLAGL